MPFPPENPLLRIHRTPNKHVILNPYSFAAAGGGGGGFVPTDIAGLNRWHAARLEAFANNASVATIGDQSANGRTATQATGGNQATFKTGIMNGLPVFRFDGSNDEYDWASLSGLSAATVFVVLSVVGNYGLWKTTGDNNGTYYDLGGTIYDSFGSNVGNRREFDRGGDTSVPHLYTVKASSSGWEAFRNGVSLFSTGTNTVNMNATPALLGFSGAFHIQADIAEIILYDSALGTSDRQSVEDYIGGIYALSITH